MALPDVTNDDESAWVAQEVVATSIRSASGSIACLGLNVHICFDGEWVDAAIILGADRAGHVACLTARCEADGSLGEFEACLRPTDGVWLDGLLAGLGVTVS
jgi:hypothetical protein